MPEGDKLTTKSWIATGTAVFGLLAAALLVAERYYNVIKAKREADRVEIERENLGKETKDKEKTIQTPPSQDNGHENGFVAESKVREALKGRWASQVDANSEYTIFSFGDESYRADLCTHKDGKGTVIACSCGTYKLYKLGNNYTVTQYIDTWNPANFNINKAPMRECEIITIQGKKLHLRSGDGYHNYILFKVN